MAIVIGLVRNSLFPGPAYARPADGQALCFWHRQGCIPAGGRLEPEPSMNGVGGRRMENPISHPSQCLV